MRKNYQFFVYIMASTSGTLYIGVTSNLMHRVSEHKNEVREGFTKKYHCKKLVYFEEYQYIHDAAERETQLKKWRREKKETLIASLNPSWKDLAGDWYESNC
ncbi:MAG: GIY-YIG nuclease family protein [Candidatus Altimarinota bacterium]